MSDYNNSYKYHLICDDSYGIECKNHQGITVNCIHNITESKEEAERLVMLLNIHKASPLHFEDIIEDELI